MADAVRSINQIVASGDTDGDWPFVFDVKAKADNVAGVGGTFIAESGVIFPNSSVDQIRVGKRQVEPFLGIGNLNHECLGKSYCTGRSNIHNTLIVWVVRPGPMIGNLALSTYWVGSEGTDQGS